MEEALIVSIARTAVGKAPRGTLRNTRPDDMAAAVISEALRRVPGLEPAEVEDVLSAGLDVTVVAEARIRELGRERAEPEMVEARPVAVTARELDVRVRRPRRVHLHARGPDADVVRLPEKRKGEEDQDEGDGKAGSHAASFDGTRILR